MKVLIIDDSRDARAIARARLEKEGYTILAADGGRSGIEQARQQRPDLVLLDLDMPDLSGFETCRQLKADQDTCMIPVIFLAGSDSRDDKVKGLDLGAVDYVTKPFDAFELRARVRAALRTKRLQDLLIQFSQIDPLTELWNRRALIERLGQEWSRIRRNGGSLAFVMADVDHFKPINDTHGHHVGDRAICGVGHVLAGECRHCDVAARYGGEEFAVMLPDQTAAQAARYAERCRQQIEQMPLRVGADTLHLTASFGVADSSQVACADELPRLADAALYEAKHAGRNRVVQADPAAAIAPAGGG